VLWAPFQHFSPTSPLVYALDYQIVWSRQQTKRAERCKVYTVQQTGHQPTRLWLARVLVEMQNSHVRQTGGGIAQLEKEL